MLPTQKVIQSTIGIYAPENIQGRDSRDRQVTRLGDNGGVFGLRVEFQGVILAAHSSGVEEVVGFFHIEVQIKQKS